MVLVLCVLIGIHYILIIDHKFCENCAVADGYIQELCKENQHLRQSFEESHTQAAKNRCVLTSEVNLYLQPLQLID